MYAAWASLRTPSNSSHVPAVRAFSRNSAIRVEATSGSSSAGRPATLLRAMSRYLPISLASHCAKSELSELSPHLPSLFRLFRLFRRYTVSLSGPPAGFLLQLLDAAGGLQQPERPSDTLRTLVPPEKATDL